MMNLRCTDHFINRHLGIDENSLKEMLAQINAAYDDEPDATEQAIRKKVRRKHRRIVEGEW